MTACSTTWRAPTAAAVCDVLAFATGFDALTGGLTRIDPKGCDGQRLSKIIGLMVDALGRGITEVEPRRDAARAWTGGVAEAAERTLFPRAQSSWYLGANIQGKKRVFMPYAGGFGNYRNYLDDAAQRGYPGLILTTGVAW